MAGTPSEAFVSSYSETVTPVPDAVPQPTSVAPTGAPSSGTGGSGSGGNAQGGTSSRWAFLSIAFYQPFFDVDTLDVALRLRDSVFPFPKSHFLEMTALNPDMYGPFWICTTLIFLSAVLGNFSSYLSTAIWHPDAIWHYNIKAVSWAAFIFYGYAFVIPLLLFLLLRYISASAGLVQLWCLYGYSLAIFIPISFLSIVPLEVLRWVVVMLGTAVSVVFLGMNLRAQITDGHELWMPITLGAMVLQAGLGVLLKMYFFTTVI